MVKPESRSMASSQKAPLLLAVSLASFLSAYLVTQRAVAAQIYWDASSGC